jgi:cobalt-precorrin 5A hydrolase
MERHAMRVVGLGLRAAATPASLEELFQRLHVTPDLPLAVPAFRESHPAVLELQQQGRTIIPVPEAALKGVATPTRSTRILSSHGTGSIAEACAIVAAGSDARIIVPRVVSTDGCATAAIAQSDERPDP